jgi:hypothetical protein
MAILDFGALIRQLGPAAVELSLGESSNDDKAIAAILNQGSSNRAPMVRKWLEYYNVFRGFTGAERNAVSETVLNWADSQQPDSTLGTLESLLSAHASLEHACAVYAWNVRSERDRQSTGTSVAYTPWIHLSQLGASSDRVASMRQGCRPLHPRDAVGRGAGTPLRIYGNEAETRS